MKPSRIVSLIAVLAALIVIECSLFSRCGQELTEKQAIALQTPEPTAVPQPTAVPTPLPTATPRPTPEPTATPEPSSAEPAGSEEPVFSIAEQGTISSDTGTAMNLIAEWTAAPNEDGNIVLTVKGTVESYSLQVRDLDDGVTVTLGDFSTDCDTHSIYISDNIYTVSELFETTLTVPADTVGTLTVCWHYNGTYSGISLSDITAAGDVTTPDKRSTE